MTSRQSGNKTGARRWDAALMNNYGTPAVTLERGEGSHVWDADGTRYLDLFGGIAVNILGHAHPAIVEAVTRQIGTLGHTSNFFATGPAVELAETLLRLTGFGDQGRVLLCNSGTEAVEAAFKITRRTGRTKIIATENSFHGRTMGALALTGQPAKRTPFEPLPAGVTHLPFGDVEAMRAAVDDQTAAVVLEPVQGEAGVVLPPEGYLRAVREITAEHGALLVIDEVQTGIGRTGSWFAFQSEGIVPDVLTIAKQLGGGLPIGACIAVGPAARLLAPGQHGTTFGGNPVCCAAALAVLRTVDEDGLLDNVNRVGKALTAGIENLGHPLLAGVRGSGLLIGVLLNRPVAARVADEARAAGYLVNPTQPDVLRLAPPLILTIDEAEGFVRDLPAVLDASDPAAENESGD
ncbi:MULTISPECIES: acetylornithine transaminase [Actinoalloteichus]|uniref:Acetylornithine aminotransferase n=1 Tax=Actinoalloteichus fjordicus TaxID=1612552 RepID=A0AAC9LFB9_9PSEU|nr:MULTISPECIES: acetylornithine transaminase [Actinoalloteichus]APU16346.1 acetylornithine/succinylornithine aminotransferase [Actinoalloteichus fjordicus]APU22405.1 acetylornithine/succinylornithine aminotransferase [Actinoalloteichus sp. GBA129-24]